MYKDSVDDINRFLHEMDAIRSENQEIKWLKGSSEYRTGERIRGLVKGIHPKRIKKYRKELSGKLKWKKVCRKYPINYEKDSTLTAPCYFSNEKFVVYTCIFGNYDTPQEPVFLPNNCEFYIITDQIIKPNSAWKVLNLDSMFKEMNLTNVEKNRFCKMLPHRIFSDFRYSVYIDGNVKPISDFTELLNRCPKEGMAFHMHKARNCVYDEIEACRILGKASAADLVDYRKYLESHAFPHKYGMNECNVIVRDHKNKLVCRIMEEWWQMFKNGKVKRDQLTFPYLLFKHGICPESIGTLGKNVQDNPALRVTGHN